MKYIFPDYYNQFQCTADKCEDTCCAGWQIAADTKSMNRYKLERGPYRFKLLRSIHWLSSTFRQNKNLRCAFLNDNNLCDMYTNLGPDSLCKTCHLYPRHIEEFEGIREITLSISCPEVCRYLMNRTEPVVFKSVEREGEEEYDDFDPFLFSNLEDARDVMLNTLQNRALSIAVRTQIILAIAHDMQRRINQQNLFSCFEVLEKYQTSVAMDFVAKYVESMSVNAQFTRARCAFDFLCKMELLRPDWSIVLGETKRRLYEGHSAQEWKQTDTEFTQWIKDQQFPWDIQKEQLLLYFISTYFCGAVYDGQVYKRAHMAATSVLLLNELVKATWLRNERQLNIEDVVTIVYRYSREIEHSDINLKRFF